MTDKGKYYITTAIAYASGKPHIGNTYEIILADAIARFKRMEGYDVFFQTGTDEHGQKIENKAKEAGVEPKAYVDRTAAEIRRIWDLMNTSYDKFIRTTDEDHGFPDRCRRHRNLQEFKKTERNGRTDGSGSSRSGDRLSVSGTGTISGNKEFFPQSSVRCPCDCGHQGDERRRGHRAHGTEREDAAWNFIETYLSVQCTVNRISFVRKDDSFAGTRKPPGGKI